MAPVVVNPAHVREFRNRDALYAWYRKNHDKADEIWIRVFKKDSGHPSVTIGEALDCALCWGWIDAIRKSLDEMSYLQRYTPRGRKSIWSRINQGHVARLIADGTMTEHGVKQVDAAKADGRWDRAYGAGARLETPPALLAAIEADPAALAIYERLNAQNRFALAFRVHNLKTPAGRDKRIAAFVDMLRRGETIYPQDLDKPPRAKPAHKAAARKRPKP